MGCLPPPSLNIYYQTLVGNKRLTPVQSHPAILGPRTHFCSWLIGTKQPSDGIPHYLNYFWFILVSTWKGKSCPVFFFQAMLASIPCLPTSRFVRCPSITLRFSLELHKATSVGKNGSLYDTERAYLEEAHFSPQVCCRPIEKPLSDFSVWGCFF